ncbi:type II secretion system F family protein [Nocardioides sp. Kera G14]|uniref:type II secretion system F family protein n=1 Tax=Nocardioides sp. Kera G14 TaxID=2884264 RepID=UPI001D118D10|nr:type II secretion system F family protein [Nocardioides sp. Kera G14]UDY23765.1 type II secretion system F family protein [Nocardioides sp. Kera G14]
MTNVMLLVPGLAVAVAAVLACVGYRQMRADTAEGLGLDDLRVLRPEQRRNAAGEGPVGRLASRLAPSVRRRLPTPATEWLQRQVDLAGRPDGMSVDSVLRMMLMWFLIVSPLLFIELFSGSLLLLVLALAVPVIMPLARVSRFQRLRREALDRDLPDFLDVLAVTVGAGVGFRPALRRVSERFGGPLAVEMTLALSQVQHGASVRSAFESLRDRSDSEALAQFVTAFLQTDELGAPLVEALNQIALDMRRESAQRMRRKAARVAPRVTLVTSLILVPGTLIPLMVGMFLGSGINVGDVFGGS